MTGSSRLRTRSCRVGRSCSSGIGSRRPSWYVLPRHWQRHHPLTLLSCPPALQDSTDPADRKRVSDWDIQQIAKRVRLEDEALKVEQERPQLQFEGNSVGAIRVPDGWDAHWDHRKRATFFVNRFTGAQQWEVPLRPARREPIAPRVTAPIDANEIIAQAERAARAAAEAEQRRIADEKAAVEAERREKEERRRLERDEKARAQKEKKVMGLFSGVVVATMSKYRKEFEGEAFKKRAREVSPALHFCFR